MARDWTPAQRAAINTRDRTLLVSAAAGSGKTATLTERIIRSVLEKDASITDMLIVTFTNAAVGELRERINSTLSEALAKDPANDALRRELLLLPSAKICTIDSYCGELVRQNAESIGISPSYRICDSAEADLLKENILDGMISAVYEGELPDIASAEEFDLLCDCLTDMKNQDSMIRSLKFVYERSLNTDEGVRSLRALVDDYKLSEGIEGSKYFEYARDNLHRHLNHYIGVLRNMEIEFSSFGGRAAKHIECIGNDIINLSSILGQTTYGGIREALFNTSFTNSPGTKAGEGAPPLTPVRKIMREELDGIRQKFFTFTPEEWRNTAEGLHRHLSALCRFIEHFDKVFLAEKMRRASFEYSDIERFAFGLLWQNGERTELALSQAKMYTHIYIDEYQDVNTIQARIFDAVSNSDNCFMVGDIKQSIYGFRNANPTLFAKLKSSYKPLEESDLGEASTLFMAENFRSDEGIIDFTNSVFDRIFPYFPGIGYMSGDSLSYKKPQPNGEPPYRKPEVCAVCPPTKKEREENPDMPEWLTDAPAVVARKIKRLLESERLNNGEPVRPGSISILLRAMTNAAEYAEALKNEGIPVEGIEEKSFFTNSDIELLLSLLHAIDNPRRDTYLCGLMCSPLYGFTPDELVTVSSCGTGAYFYDKLLSYTDEHRDYEKGIRFVTSLKRLRLIAEGMNVDTLIARLYRETGIFALATRNGGAERLMRFYDYAKSYEKGSFKGLYNFLSYIDKIIDRNNSFDDKEAPTSADAVRIQTIHSSKGLEYPIVFLCEAQALFNNSSRSSTERLSYNENFGISMLLRTPSGLSRVRNPMKAAVSDFTERREIEEESRNLYVALTRARERLYVVGRPRKGFDSLVRDTALASELLSDYSVYQIPSSLEMILTATTKVPLTPLEFVYGETSQSGAAPAESITEDNGNPADTSDELYDILCDRFRYVYPDKFITELPKKTSVSVLYPTVFDTTEEVSIFELEREDKPLFEKGILPSFVTGIEKRTAAKRGIATHLFMQFCDLKRLCDNGARKELDRLLSEEFISKRDGERVRLDEIELFIKSDLIKEMMASENIWREFRFNLYLPAEEFTTEADRKAAYKNQSVLVQGVIDCIYTDGDGRLHLVDYKTDRLTPLELEDPSLAARKLGEAHRLQLSYYSMATERIFGRKPDTVQVYSLPLGDTVDIIL